MGNEDNAWKNVRNASLDMTRINFATLANDVPAATLLGLPYLFARAITCGMSSAQILETDRVGSEDHRRGGAVVLR